MNFKRDGDDQLIKRQKIGNTSTVAYLPDHLMHDIILRCPAESLLRFKSVCKDWCLLVKDPNFAKQYYDHHKGNNDSMGMVLMTSTTDHPEPEGFDLANFNKLCDYDVDHVEILQAEELELELSANLEFSLKLTTCKGMVCFYRDYPVLMWNPVTRESIMISKPRIDQDKEYANACGFGFDDVNNEYKVVQLLRCLSNSSLECMVLNLGTNKSWRRIQHQDNFVNPILRRPDDNPESLFSDGSIYWWTYEDILSFDVTTEIFKRIAAPAPVQRSTRPYYLQQRLVNYSTTKTYMVELGKSLCFVEHYICDGLMDLWMMQAETKTPWVLGYSIDLEPISKSAFYIKSVYIRGKKIYLTCMDGLACYDTETKHIEMVYSKTADCYNSAVTYTKSIVCLHDIVGSKCVSTAHIGECGACPEWWHIVPKI